MYSVSGRVATGAGEVTYALGESDCCPKDNDAFGEWPGVSARGGGDVNSRGGSLPMGGSLNGSWALYVVMPAEDRSGETGLLLPEKNSPFAFIPIAFAAARGGTVTGVNNCSCICICIGGGGGDENGNGSFGGSWYELSCANGAFCLRLRRRMKYMSA